MFFNFPTKSRHPRTVDSLLEAKRRFIDHRFPYGVEAQGAGKGDDLAGTKTEDCRCSGVTTESLATLNIARSPMLRRERLRAHAASTTIRGVHRKRRGKSIGEIAVVLRRRQQTLHEDQPGFLANVQTVVHVVSGPGTRLPRIACESTPIPNCSRPLSNNQQYAP